MSTLLHDMGLLLQQVQILSLAPLFPQTRSTEPVATTVVTIGTLTYAGNALVDRIAAGKSGLSSSVVSVKGPGITFIVNAPVLEWWMILLIVCMCVVLFTVMVIGIVWFCRRRSKHNYGAVAAEEVPMQVVEKTMASYEPFSGCKELPPHPTRAQWPFLHAGFQRVVLGPADSILVIPRDWTGYSTSKMASFDLCSTDVRVSTFIFGREDAGIRGFFDTGITVVVYSNIVARKRQQWVSYEIASKYVALRRIGRRIIGRNDKMWHVKNNDERPEFPLVWSMQSSEVCRDGVEMMFADDVMVFSPSLFVTMTFETPLAKWSSGDREAHRYIKSQSVFNISGAQSLSFLDV